MSNYIPCFTCIWLIIHALISMMVLLIDVNTMRPQQNGRHFPDDIFKCIFLNENVWISIKISLKFVPNSPIYNIPALVQIMAWGRLGDKPLSKPMMVGLLTHICLTRPKWVNKRGPRLPPSLKNLLVLNSLVPEWCGTSFKSAISEYVLWIQFISTSRKIAFRWMAENTFDDKSTLVQVMAWCHQATSHYLSQCWPRSVLPYGITGPQWVNITSCTINMKKKQ